MRLALAVTASVPLFLSACTAASPEATTDTEGLETLSGGDSTGTGGTDANPTSGASAGTGTSEAEGSSGLTPEESSSSGGPGATSSSTSSSGGGEMICQTVLCGESEECCDAADECVLGACLDACDSGVRCGVAQDICCGGGQVCLADTCADPTGACEDSFDCALGEFCEPTLEQCLPQFDPVSCEVVPSFEEVSVTQEWSYEAQEVISIPVVADIDGDGAPEVVVNTTQRDGLGWAGGNIVVLDGQTGAVELEVPHDPAGGSWGSHGRATVGLTDVSGDGLPDIIYAARPEGGVSRIVAIDSAGTLLWSSHDGGGAVQRFNVENGAPSFANFDDDDEAEIVFGAAMLDHDGLVVWNQGGNGAAAGTNDGYTGGISALADLDGDGGPEVVSGRRAWSVDWVSMVGMDPVVTVTEFWDAGGADGYPAVADVDLDGTPEVILVSAGQLRVLDGITGAAWAAPVTIPGGGRGGPPTVADFDGDGLPELATAGGSSYTVYDVVSGPNDVFVLWSAATQDQSSNATGSSVFDFQGDGAAEVVYADECYMRVYDGASGDVVLEIESSSATIHEYPLVVDVDDDGNSEILVVANDSGSDCGAIGGYTERRGVFVYGDTFDQWVGTRRVWTSHAYHVTNTSSAGNAPVMEADNWADPELNNYRQNVQGAGVFNAPDLSVDLVAQLDMCDDGILQVVATVRNLGALGVPAGVEVSLYEGTDAMGALVGTETTPDPLLPGQQTQVSWAVPFVLGDAATDFFVTVDGSDAATGVVDECVEDNNDAASLGEECFFPG